MLPIRSVTSTPITLPYPERPWQQWLDSAEYTNGEWHYQFNTYKPCNMTSNDDQPELFTVALEQFSVRGFNVNNVAYPSADWLPYESNEFQSEYSPDNNELPTSALYCADAEEEVPINNYQSIFTAPDVHLLCQYYREERANNKNARSLNWRITSRGEYLDSRMDKIDVLMHANRFHNFKDKFNEEYPDDNKPMFIKGPSIMISHPCITYEHRNVNWKSRIMNILYNNCSRFHPIRLLSIDDTKIMTWKHSRASGSVSAVLHINAGSQSFYRLQAYGEWKNSIEAINYNNVAFKFKVRMCGVVAPQRRIALFNVPRGLIQSSNGADLICKGFRFQVKRLIVMNLINQLILSNYDLAAINLTPVLANYIDIDAVREYSKLHCVDSLKSNSNSKQEMDDDDLANHEDAIDDYVYSETMINDMVSILEQLYIQNDDIYDAIPVNEIRDWAMDQTHLLQNIRSFQPSWPPCFNPAKLNLILHTLVPNKWIKRVGYTFSHCSNYRGKRVSITPVFTKDINVNLLVGLRSKQLPAPLIQTGSKRIGASLYHITPMNDYLGMLFCCGSCGFMFPGHTPKGCADAFSYKAKAERAIDIEAKRNNWSVARKNKAKNAIVVKKCRHCGEWGHLTWECPRTQTVSCTQCAGRHPFKAESRVCLFIKSVSRIISNAEIMVYQFHIPNINNVPKESILHFLDDHHEDNNKNKIVEEEKESKLMDLCDEMSHSLTQSPNNISSSSNASNASNNHNISNPPMLTHTTTTTEVITLSTNDNDLMTMQISNDHTAPIVKDTPSKPTLNDDTPTIRLSSSNMPLPRKPRPARSRSRSRHAKKEKSNDDAEIGDRQGGDRKRNRIRKHRTRRKLQLSHSATHIDCTADNNNIKKENNNDDNRGNTDDDDDDDDIVILS